ncbi:neuraminidase-like domain-containing protein [Nonomuraea typhae]|uniref:Neuraminidase-like domain-containing protein n=1 Tax=Nonomuraea typhae TaxID=2603600 RepID=A0ABW7ZDA3_9ACTN
MPTPPRSYTVQGLITDADDRPLPDVLVRASGPGQAHQEVPLGQAPTGADGRYGIRVEEDPDEPHHHVNTVIIKVFAGDREIGKSHPPKRKEIPKTVIDLKVDHRPDPAPARRVFGLVRNKFGELMSDVVVRAADRDLRHEQPLGQSEVREGRYEVRYSEAQFRRAEKDSADLVLTITDTAGAQLFRSPVQYNAPAEYEFNLSLDGAVYGGPSLWEVQTGVLTPLLDGLGPVDLREDEQHQDVSFLVGETGYTALEIGTWAASWRLAERTARDGTPLPPESLFAFIHQGEPSIFRATLLDDLKHPERIALMEDALLRALAALLPQRQRELLVKAVDGNLVPARLRESIEAILATLATINLRYTADVAVGGGKGTIGQLLDVVSVPQAQRQAILSTLASYSGSLAGLWKKLEEDETLPEATVKQVRLSVELGTLTRNHVPLVASLAEQVSGGQVTKQDLARFSKQEWFAVFARPGPDGRPVGVPDNIDGETPEQKKETYAAILDQQFERAYPTASLSAKAARASSTAPQLSERVIRFLDDHPDFQLDRYRIDHYLAERDRLAEGNGGTPDPATLDELAAVQRVFKLQPTFAAANTLLARGIDSAQKIYFMGQGQFVDAVAGTSAGTPADAPADEVSPINRIQARILYEKAEATYALALTTYADLNAALYGVSPAALAGRLLDAETQAKIDALPNLRTLFGSVDYCACAACQSVYSPAAHFVDVLRFLGDRGTRGQGVHAGKSVRQVLLERRPDLGDIELSCENTNTPLPYIDLVNEILEDVVAPPPAVPLPAAIRPRLVEGPIAAEVLAELRARNVAIAGDAFVYDPDVRGHWVIRDKAHSYVVVPQGAELGLRATRQTIGSAAEVRANPEHLNLEAYRKLAGEVFPFALPFDLASEQTRGYLGQLGLPQERLFTLFGQTMPDGTVSTPTPAQIDCALLGVGDAERQIVTGALPGRQPWEFWGLAETGNTIPHPDDPAQVVTGTWLEVLAKVPVMLHRAELSYRDLLQLLDTRYADPAQNVAVAEREGCDTSAFTVSGLNADVLGRIHRFVRLWRRLGIPQWELDLFLAGRTLDEAALRDLAGLRRLAGRTGLDLPSLITVFRGFDDHEYVDRSAEEGAPVQTVYQRLFRNKLVDATGTFPPRAAELSGTIGQRVPGLLAGLRIGEPELDLVLADLSLDRTAPLTAAVLNRIHRVAVLARGLGLPVRDFLRLARIAGTDPFASPAHAVAFAGLADEVLASAFSVVELDYLLTHTFTANAGVALEDRTVLASLRRLRQGLIEIADRLRRQADQTDAAYVGAKLGLLPALAADRDLVAALALVDGSWNGPAAQRGPLIDRYFAAIFDDLAAARAALAALPPGETPAQRQARIDARFALVAPRLEAFLLRTHKDLFVDQHVAALLRIDEVPAATALSLLTLSGSTARLRAVINDPRLVDPALELDEAAFPAVYAALRLLHKVAMLIGKLGMRPAEVTWWLTGANADGLGWIRAGALGVDRSTTVALSRWTSMRWFFDWKAGLPASELSALDFAAILLDPAAASAATLAALAKLTAWKEADLTALATAYGWLATGVDNVKARLAVAANLRRVADAMTALRLLGVTAARAVAWAGATPDAAVADEIKQVLKARYDLPQWLDANRPVQDALRERRRDVLADWLAAHPDPALGQRWTDADGLYSHFLIDVEMSACALTSRLKQATGSAQLFVQRVLQNLERDIVADTVADPKWKQWQWMRRYRVWEANRKVFLYPENWIEPELREEKSPFFVELERDLQQQDVTAATVEEAYRVYLDKLDKVANLEIRAVFEQRIGDESILHVISRTRSSTGAEYFYRTRLNKARWTAWQPVKLEIKADHMQIGLHNRRLYIMWPQLMEKAEEPTSIRTPRENSTSSVELPRRYWDVQLYWSELKNGTWTPKVLSDAPLRVRHFQTGGNRPENIAFRIRHVPQIRAHLYVTADPGAVAPRAGSTFEKLGPQITPGPLDHWEHLISPPESVYHGNLIKHGSAAQYFYYSSVAEFGKAHEIPAHQNAPAIRVLRNITPGRTFSVIDAQAAGFAETGTFFTWDPARAYHVDYEHRTYWSYSYWGWWYSWSVSTFRFAAHYHPFVELFTKELNVWGLRGVLNRRIQVSPRSVPGSPAPFDFAAYQPDFTVAQPYPEEEVDFSYGGAYAPYNWELFFHLPMLIAGKLAANQRFEEALEWYHYVFDPTSTDTETPDPATPQQKYWITKPFFETTKDGYYKQKIENMLLAIAKGDAELRAQVAEWRQHPFSPHTIARMRTVAYQKNVLIKYIQTLTAWGDQLFAQDTIESINEATQLYVLAGTILGPRPKSVPRRVPDPVRTFYQLQARGIDDFGNVLLQVENLLPGVPGPTAPAPEGPELPRLDVLYFGVPNNDKLLALWDAVEDRLFKIRHCMNIEGVVRQLPLFEPPIDPALLVKATAAGLDVAAAISDINAPMPPYRFPVMIQRAQEVCAAVTALGAAMLAALEKRDVETLAALRSSHEIAVLDLLRDVRESQVREARATWEANRRNRDLAELRRTYHQRLLDQGLNTGEKVALALSGVSLGLEAAVAVGYVLSGGLSLVPTFLAGAAGFGGSPTVSASMGGQQIGNAAEMAVATLRSLATAAEKGAAMAGVLAGHARRAQDWDYQRNLAATELPQIDKQILAAEIRHQIAQQDLRQHDKQRANAAVEDEFQRGKFTDAELYDWMIGQLSTVYFQSYQLAFDLAKRAERCFRYELGLSDSSYIRHGYWDSLRKGLLAGERLGHDLRRLDAAFLDLNKREYELTKHVSLAQLDPVALLQLKRNGECLIDLPEVLFDLDHPGHYFRRVQSVSLTVPCVVGPYGSVAATLTLTGDSLRKDATLLAGKYARNPAGDTRFRDGLTGVQSIATSSAVDDDGLFDLTFEDERYLPFEGAGAISSWHLRLNADVPQFDLGTISDVVIHLRYTAREGGGLLRAEALRNIDDTLSAALLAGGRTGLYRALDLKREFPDAFYRFLHPANPADEQELTLGDLAERLPLFTRAFPVRKVRAVEVAALMADGQTYEVALQPVGGALLPLPPDTVYQGMHRAHRDLTGSEAPMGGWTLKIRRSGAPDFRSLPPDEVRELFLIVNYTVERP